MHTDDDAKTSPNTPRETSERLSTQHSTQTNDSTPPITPLGQRFHTGKAYIFLGLSLILSLIALEILVDAYFPQATFTTLVSNIQNQRGDAIPRDTVANTYGDLRKPTRPLLTNVRRGLGKPGEKLVFDDFTASLSFNPAQPIAGEATDVIWTLTDRDKNALNEWDLSVHNTINHSYLIRSDFQSKSFHVHPGVLEDGTTTESIQFPTAGEWVISTQIAKGGTVYLLTALFNVYNQDGTTEPEDPGTHTTEELRVTGARGIDFSRSLPLRQWNIEMMIEGGEPVRANEPFIIEWVATPREGENPPNLRGSILDGGQNILMANIDDPSLIWNMHGDRSQEPISRFLGITTTRWSTSDNPFKFTVSLPKPGLWWIHFEIQSSPVHFFIDVAKNPDASIEAPLIDRTTVIGRAND